MSVVALMLAPARLGRDDSVGGGVALVQRAGDPVEERVGDRALGLERQVVARPVGGEDRDPVRLGPETGAGLGHVVGDEEVDALAAELLGGALERPGLGREADEDRPRARAARGSGPVAVEPVGDARDLGQQVGRRLELQGQGVAARQLRRRRSSPAGSRPRPRP